MKYEYLFFDADNTLWDFDLSEKFALFKVLTDHGVEYELEHLQSYHEINKACWRAFENGMLSAVDLKPRRFQLLCEKFGWSIDPVQMGKQYLQYLASTDFMIPGATNLLEQVAGQRRLVLVTNGLQEVQRRRLANTGIEKYFEAIVISDEIGVAKPHAPFFKYAFEQVGLPTKEKVLMIGDSLHSDIQGGNSYGLSTCWFNPKQLEKDVNIWPSMEIKALEELYEII